MSSFVAVDVVLWEAGGGTEMVTILFFYHRRINACAFMCPSFTKISSFLKMVGQAETIWPSESCGF